MNIKKILVGGAASAIMLGALIVPAFASTLFSNGFETDITGWETPTRVASGTNGIASAT